MSETDIQTVRDSLKECERVRDRDQEREKELKRVGDGERRLDNKRCKRVYENKRIRDGKREYELVTKNEKE